jgi:hypothetical protein
MRSFRGGGSGGDGAGGGGSSATPGKRSLTDTIQRRARSAPAEAPAEAPVDSPTSGSQLPAPVQAKMEHAFDFDFSGVRVHEGGEAASVGAAAYAQGSDLHFAPGQYDPASRGGQELLGHELAHVVQQSEGRVAATTQFKGVDGNDDAGLEREADDWGARAAAGEEIGRSGHGALPTAHGPVQRTPGKETHSATVGSGKVTARENDEDPSDKSNDNFSLDYSGKDADKAHWLQFVNFMMYADDSVAGRVYYTGDIQTTSGKKPFSTDKVTNWSVDSNSGSDPYYEATGSNQRDPGKSTKMFDEPGGPSINGFAAQHASTKAPKATTVTFIASFDTYLVQDGKSTYHVTWTATTVYDVAKKTSAAIAYHTGAGGAVTALPKDLKKILDTSYSGNKIT